MLKVLFKVVYGVFYALTHKKDGFSKDFVGWANTHITVDDLKSLRVGKFGFWLETRIVKHLTAFISKFKKKLKPLDLSSQGISSELDTFVKSCVAELENNFKVSGMITLNGSDLGDSAKWHGVYVASLYRLKLLDQYKLNLDMMAPVLITGLMRHPLQTMQWTPISPDTVSGYAQALLVPPAEDTADLRKHAYDHFVASDFFLPYPDGSLGELPVDLTPNLLSNDGKTLAWFAVKLMGNAVTKDDMFFLKYATDAKPLAGDTNVYGVQNCALLADAIMCAMPETKQYLLPYVEGLLEREPGAMNPEMLSILLYHGVHNTEYKAAVLKQLSELIGDPFKVGTTKSGGFADHYLHISERCTQDYYWQRPANELKGVVENDTVHHAKLDAISPYSRIS